MIKTGSILLAAIALGSTEALEDLSKISAREDLVRPDPAGRTPLRRERIRENERRARARYKSRLVR
ncbi:MAG: hypothetical protein IMZ57_11180 [Acidobacteria bacterium]|nr:hypothetical protein [Acidobacteriota bacterium]